MSLSGHDAQLASAIKRGTLGAVNAALEAGVTVNGSPGEPYAPIVAATIANNADMVNVLLGKSADANRPVTVKVPCPGPYVVCTVPGKGTLHIAARSGKVDIVSLLQRGRADANTTDSRGDTPLMATCTSLYTSVDVVPLLLAAGADPSLPNEDGCIPLHAAAANDSVNLIDTLYSSAPTTLDRCGARGRTPLFLACYGGHESTVFKLLSLGAMQQTPVDGTDMCPLWAAVGKGCLGVVRVLMNEGETKAVGGEIALPQALVYTARFRETRILRLLLTVDGEEKRSEWANIRLGSRHLLHFAAGCCCPTEVSTLPEAGADEAARDRQRRLALDYIGLDLSGRDWAPIDPGEENAIRRVLQRGPAYRARSWGWPLDAKEARVGCSSDGNTSAAATLPSPPAVNNSTLTGVRIFRHQGENQ